MAKKEKQTEKVGDSSIALLDGHLKSHKEDHLNYEKSVDWTASTGSLLFDSVLGGGFKPGGIKVAGASFAGKSSSVLNCFKNGLETIPNCKALWVKAEGRLAEDIQERSGVKFVFKPEEWVVGTCFVLETNIYECVIDLINKLIKNNPDEIRYLFAIDSVDALIRRDDDEKDAAEGEKVGAGGLLLSLLFKKAGLILNKKGHCLFALTQLRAKVETNQYAPKDQNKSVGGGGSNALVHGVNQVWQFRGRTKQVNIEEKGSVVGHYCVIDLSKGVDEKIDVRVEYPIRHRMKGGKSVWLEKEIADLLIQWELVDKAGAWLTFSEDLIQELREAGFTIEDNFKIQGDAKLKDWLEQNPEVVQYLYKKFLKLFSEA